MELNLAAFLSCHKALVEDSAVWGDLPLRITSYLSNELPPSHYITSVRGIIFHNDSILVVRNPQGIHISPGGQREAGETLEETLRREVLEETGWTITEVRMLGFVHFHHLNPKPPDYKYLHPDFIQLIYVAQAAQFIPEAKLVGDYEIESGFRPLDEVKTLNLSPGERLALDAALKYLSLNSECKTCCSEALFNRLHRGAIGGCSIGMLGRTRGILLLPHTEGR
ncbi:NUDIX domain-containing protein [Candidatus Poribacteria bacterium]|nr:NUDIX domain-containing protein [Candidatus Poribacteria bacterium]